MSTPYTGEPAVLAARAWLYRHRFNPHVPGQVTRVSFDAQIVLENGSHRDIIRGLVILKPQGWRMLMPRRDFFMDGEWVSTWPRLSDAEFQAVRYAIRKQLQLLNGRN